MRIKLAPSNFARWFRGVLGRESPILGYFGIFGVCRVLGVRAVGLTSSECFRVVF